MTVFLSWCLVHPRVDKINEIEGWLWLSGQEHELSCGPQQPMGSPFIGKSSLVVTQQICAASVARLVSSPEVTIFSLRPGNLWHFHIVLGLAWEKWAQRGKRDARRHRMCHWARSKPPSASSIGSQLIIYPWKQLMDEKPNMGIGAGPSYKAWLYIVVLKLWSQTAFRSWLPDLISPNRVTLGKHINSPRLSVSICIVWGLNQECLAVSGTQGKAQ